MGDQNTAIRHLIETLERALAAGTGTGVSEQLETAQRELAALGQAQRPALTAEDVVRKSEDFFAISFRQGPLPQLLSSLSEGRIFDVNERFCSLSGYSRDEVLGQSSVELRLWADPVRRDEVVALLRQHGRVEQQEFEFRKKSGEMILGGFSAGLITRGHRSWVLSTIQDLTDQKRAEEALRQEKTHYQDLVNAQPLGIYRIRVRGEAWNTESWRKKVESQYSVETVSDRFCEISGVSREQFLANPGVIPDRIHPDDQADFVRRNVEALAATAPFHWEGRLVRSGEVIWIRFEGLPRRLDDGDVVWTGILSDVSERKHRDEALHRSHTVLQGMINGADAPVFALDRDLRYTCFNDAHASVMKAVYGADIALGRSLLDFQTPEEDRAKSRANLARALAGERVVESAFSGDGAARRYFEVVHHPIRDAAGQVTGVGVFAWDRTAQLQAQEAVHEGEDKFRQMFELSPVAKSLTSADGALLPNRALCELLGYSSEELTAMAWPDVSHPGDVASTNQAIEELLSGRKASVRFNKRYLRKDGSVVWAEVSTAPRRSSDGRHLGFMTTINDVTDRRRAEEEVQAQLAELQRWYLTTLDREDRVREVKREVNLLLAKLGEPPRYEEVRE